MRAKLRPVGNSVGLTIPANELRAIEAHAGDIVEVEIKRVVCRARAGWADPAQWSGVVDEDLLLKGVPETAFDDEEWEW